MAATWALASLLFLVPAPLGVAASVPPTGAQARCQLPPRPILWAPRSRQVQGGQSYTLGSHPTLLAAWPSEDLSTHTVLPRA